MITLLVVTSLAFAAPIDDLLSKTQSDLEKLVSSEGALLVPKTIKDATDNLEDARSLLEKGKKTEAIEKKINAANEAIRNANSLIQTGFSAFEGVLKARADCDVVSASERAEDTFSDAVKSFDKAVDYLEAQKMDGVRSKLVESENLFRQAELEAIKVLILSEPERLIELAEKSDAMKYAPSSIERARIYRAEAEVILNRDRYAQEEAQAKADESAYEANHSMFITSKAQSTESMKEGFEIFYLEVERNLSTLSNQLSYKPRYERGFSEPIEEMTTLVSTLFDSSQSSIQELKILNEGQELELNALREQVSSLESQYALKDSLLTDVTTEFAQLKLLRDKENKLRSMEDLFEKGEMVFHMEESDLELEALALSYVAGKIKIEENFTATLQNISTVIQAYNPSEILIIGHGDPDAAQEQNEALSRVRAETVRDSLIQVLPIEMENRIKLHISFPEESLEVVEESPEIEADESTSDVVETTEVDNLSETAETDSIEVAVVDTTETEAESFTMRKQRNNQCIWFFLKNIKSN